MSVPEPTFTIGMEEEYLLVDRATRALATDPPTELLDACKARIKDLVHPEFMKSQIEVNTTVCTTVADARKELAWLRQTVADVANQYNLAPIAASTHPFSKWSSQTHTEAARYDTIANDTQGIGRRLIICGMHVHVGIEDEDMRIDLMNQASYFLPHLLSLSASSPFWQGEDTGLQSYRLCVFHQLPRTGLPEQFASYSGFERHVQSLATAGIIKDGSYLWWDIRPSIRFPTLEMRITDICPLLDDAAAIAALYLSILRMLYRLRRANQRWRSYAPMLVRENVWRAQRYGLEEGLVDFGRDEIVPVPDLLEELIELVQEDAKALGCGPEIQHIRTIAKRGTSAQRQRATYAHALDAGAAPEEALKAVVDQLIEETVTDL